MYLNYKNLKHFNKNCKIRVKKQVSTQRIVPGLPDILEGIGAEIF
jgi:hypothetical protein